MMSTTGGPKSLSGWSAFTPSSTVPAVGRGDGAGLLSIRARHEHGRRGQIVGRAAHELAVELQCFLRARERVDHEAAGDHRPDRVQPVLERGDDAEVAGAAADGPEEVGVLGGARVDELAVGEHDVDAQQVVDRHPEAAAEPAEAAAEREAGDTGIADRAAGRREAERLRLAVELSPAQARFRARGAGDGVDPEALHLGEIDDDPVVARRLARDVVGAAAHGNRQPLVARERDGGHDVHRAAAARDHRRALVDHRVPDAARLVVGGIAGNDHAATKVLAKSVNRGLSDGHGGACRMSDGVYLGDHLPERVTKTMERLFWISLAGPWVPRLGT